MGSYSSSSYNHILITIFPTGTTGPFHECCRPKNNLCSCVVLGSEASNLNCQYCQRCSAPSRRTDGDYCNRINCLKLLQRNQDDERRCLYIGVQILNRLPKKKIEVAMVQGHWGNILSGAQYHLKTVHLFSRADYLTIIPTVKPFSTLSDPLWLTLMNHLGILRNRCIRQHE